LHQLPLSSKRTGWTRAFEFLTDKYDLSQLSKYSVRKFDFILQDDRLVVREAIFNLIEQVTCGALDLNSDSQESLDDIRKQLIFVLHSL
jgi:hypothetical protein